MPAIVKKGSVWDSPSRAGWRGNLGARSPWKVLSAAEADSPSPSPELSPGAEPLSNRSSHPPSSQANRVLVVEDDKVSRTAMRYLLKQAGWLPAEAATLTEGRELLAKSEPHAMILDLMLPDGNGAELLGYIREKGLLTRVAVLTGIGDPDALDVVRQLRPDVLFRKPVNVQAFLQWLDSVRSL